MNEQELSILGWQELIEAQGDNGDAVDGMVSKIAILTIMQLTKNVRVV